MKQSISSSVHYFRHAADNWERILDRLKSTGFDGVDVYIPWGIHEREKGVYDFGEKSENLDLVRFLQLVWERKMWVILRPGPCVNAELPNFGLPQRIVHDPEIQARSPQQNPVLCPFVPYPFPVPSYASEKYVEETLGWFRKIIEVTKEFFSKDDFVRMIQIDNEACLFFRDAPFDQDYSESAKKLFREYIKNSGETELDSEIPPTRLEGGIKNLRLCLLWMSFRRWMVTRALLAMRKGIEEEGVKGIPFSHNFPPCGIWSFLVASEIKKVVDRVTIDIYGIASNAEIFMDEIRTVMAIEEMPYAGEMGVGSVYYTPYISEFDNRFSVVASIGCGIRGMNFYMGAERDRWLGGLVKEDGRDGSTNLIHFFTRLFDLLDSENLDEFLPVVNGCIVLPREYLDMSVLRFDMTGFSPTLMGGLGLELDGFISSIEVPPLGLLHRDWLEKIRKICRIFENLYLNYIFLEGTEDVEVLKRRFPDIGLIFIPSFLFVGSLVIEKAIEWAQKGVMAVIGPQFPKLDETFKPLDSDLVKKLDFATKEGKIKLIGEENFEHEMLSIITGNAEEFYRKIPFVVKKKDTGCRILLRRNLEKNKYLVFIVHSTDEKSFTIFDLKKGILCEHLLSVKKERYSQEFGRKKWEEERSVMIEHTGREIVVVQLYEEKNLVKKK